MTPVMGSTEAGLTRSHQLERADDDRLIELEKKSLVVERIAEEAMAFVSSQVWA